MNTTAATSSIGRTAARTLGAAAILLAAGQAVLSAPAPAAAATAPAAPVAAHHDNAKSDAPAEETSSSKLDAGPAVVSVLAPFVSMGASVAYGGVTLAAADLGATQVATTMGNAG